MPLPLDQTWVDVREGFFSRLLTKLNTYWMSSTYPFAAKGNGLSFHYAAELSRGLAPHIRLGNRVAIGKHTWFHTWIDSDVNNHIKIILDDDCRIDPRCSITAKNLIRIERNAVLSSDVLVMDHAHAYEDINQPIKDQGATQGGRILIGEGCQIGRGAAILCGKGELILGRNCVVEPGAVVTRSFPPNSRIMGNPARLAQKSDLGNGHEQLMVPQSGSNGSNASQASKVRKCADEIFPICSAISPGADINSEVGQVEVTSRRADQTAGQITEDPLAWLPRIVSKLRTLWLVLTYPFFSFGKASWVHYSFRIARTAARYVAIGDRVGLARDSRLEVSSPSVVKGSILIIENGSGLQRRCVISARNRVHIMRNVIFGPGALVSDHGYPDPDGNHGAERESLTTGGTIRIEEDCWIGFGAAIICREGELVIGKHSVIGANSVITRSVPPYSVVAGNPARIVRQYNFAESKWILGCIRPAEDTKEPQPEAAASMGC